MKCFHSFYTYIWSAAPSDHAPHCLLLRSVISFQIHHGWADSNRESLRQRLKGMYGCKYFTNTHAKQSLCWWHNVYTTRHLQNEMNVWLNDQMLLQQMSWRSKFSWFLICSAVVCVSVSRHTCGRWPVVWKRFLLVLSTRSTSFLGTCRISTSFITSQ